jgi:hypothetical protein
MDASQHWYLEIVQLGSNTTFASFYVQKVSEMLWNTPKHQCPSNGVEWMLHNLGREIVHSGSNTSYASFYVLKVSGLLQKTPKNCFGSNRVEWMVHNIGAPK